MDLPQEDLVRSAYRKRKAKLPLSDEERQALSLQQRTYAGRRTPLYCDSDEQLTTWQAMASAEGYTTFSAWVVANVKRSVAGQVVDAIEYGRLQQRVEDMREEVEYQRRHSRSVEEENKVLQQEVRRLTSEIADLTRLVNERLGLLARPPP